LKKSDLPAHRKESPTLAPEQAATTAYAPGSASMTSEQNEPQVPQAQSQPGQGQAPQGQAQGHRRRRRRRKGQNGSNAAKGQPTPQANGSVPQGNRPTPQNQNQGQKPKSHGKFFQKKSGQGANVNNNPGNGQGGRRKSKPHRQQVFVGPMDHSYRAVNGNMADGPPSTIELRNGERRQTRRLLRRTVPE